MLQLVHLDKAAYCNMYTTLCTAAVERSVKAPKASARKI